jgi:anti-anti-sigma factor
MVSSSGEGPITSASVSIAPDGTITIALSGELDVASVEALREELSPQLELNSTALIFDLSGVAFMDSSGIALLLALAQPIGYAALRHASAIVRRIIEATGVTDILRPVDD